MLSPLPACQNHPEWSQIRIILIIGHQDPRTSSWKDQRHPTMGSNLMGLLTLRIRWRTMRLRTGSIISNLILFQSVIVGCRASLACNGREEGVRWHHWSPMVPPTAESPIVPPVVPPMPPMVPPIAEQHNTRIVSELFVQLHVPVSRRRHYLMVLTACLLKLTVKQQKKRQNSFI